MGAERPPLELVLVKWSKGSCIRFPLSFALTLSKLCLRDSWFQRSSPIFGLYFQLLSTTCGNVVVPQLMKKWAGKTSLFIMKCFWKSLRKKVIWKEKENLVWIEPVWMLVWALIMYFQCDGILTFHNLSNVSLNRLMSLLFLNSYFLTTFWKQYETKLCLTVTFHKLIKYCKRCRQGE